MERKEAEDIMLVGEFMGIKNLFEYNFQRDGLLGVYIAEDEDGDIDYIDVGVNWYDPKGNWNQLMPVVEKIEEIYDEHHGFFAVHIHSNCCDIQGTKLHLALDNNGYGPVYTSDPNAILSTKIESTFYNVVKFIEWYNENLKSFASAENNNK